MSVAAGGRGRWRVREGLGDEVAEEFRKFLDLAKFIGHALAWLSPIIGDAERIEPRGVSGDEVVFGGVVGRRRRRGGRDGKRCGLHAEASAAVGVKFQLGDLGSGEEVGVEEVAAKSGLDQGDGLGGSVVFRDVAGGVAPHERELESRFEGHGSDEYILQCGIGPGEGGRGFAEGKLGQSAVGEGGS